MMDPSDDVGNLNQMVEAVALSDGLALDISTGQEDISTGQEDISTRQKDISTRQKDISTRQKDISTGQKDISTGQKDISTGQEDISTGQEDISTGQEDISTGQEDISTGQEDITCVDMLRIKQRLSNKCFEMKVRLNAAKSKRTCSVSEAERDLPHYVSELERVKTINFNSTLALHRMQMWHAIEEKLKQNDSEAEDLKAVSDRCMALCSHIKQLQKESGDLQDEVTEIQKQRLGMKRLIHEKMKEMEELKSKKDHPESEKYKAALEKGQANLERYKKIAIMTQNVLRGIILASKINWMDDPKLRDIAMTLEEFPISD